jgi:hypothetical protein
MISYKLNPKGTAAHKFVDGVETGEWHNTETSQAYLKWLSEGNTPLPPDE